MSKVSKSTVLIVDDDEVIRDALTWLIQNHGYITRSARDGEEAFTSIRREKPDLVLLDLMLPGMSGMEALEQLRQQYPHIVVVILTAYYSTVGAIEAMRMGAFDYLPKPFKNDDVVLALSKGLEQARRTREANEMRERLHERLREHDDFNNLMGKSIHR